MTQQDAGTLHGRVVVERPGFRLDVTVDVGPGQVLAVLGPNGAGKTTLLRAVAGLVPTSGGRITVAGRDWTDLAPQERRVGLLFQDYRLFPHLDALENIAFGPHARGVPRRRARALAAPWLERIGLEGLGTRRPAQLSGGQAQRVALARALAVDPAVLLLDEPLAALDAATRLELRAELHRHLHTFPGPSLLVTHDPLDALVLADQVLVLEAGHVVQQGPPTELARRPATTYVARLMGLNLYHGHTTAEPALVALDGGGTLHTTPDDTTPDDGDEEVTGAVLVALPPSAITVHTSRPAGSPRNVWPGRVSGLQMLTDRIRVTVTGTPDALVDITPAALADLRLEPGHQVWLAAKAGQTRRYREPVPENRPPRSSDHDTDGTRPPTPQSATGGETAHLLETQRSVIPDNRVSTGPQR